MRTRMHMGPGEAESRMRELLTKDGIPQPDEVTHDPDHDELNFIWHDRKLVVIVELTERNAAVDGVASPSR